MTTKNKQMTDCIQNTLHAYKGEKELGFKFLNLLVVVHRSNKGIWGSNTVMSPVLQLGTADLIWSLAEVGPRTDWAVSSGPRLSSCSWYVESVVPGVVRVEQKPNREEPAWEVCISASILHVRNITILEVTFKEICDLQDPIPGCRTNWKLGSFHRI